MKLIWHVIRKDLRAERWGLTLWAALYLAQIGLGVWLVAFKEVADPDAPRISQELVVPQLYSMALVALQALTTYFLTIRFIRADAWLGDAFWRTRPLAAWTMFGAKLTGAVVTLGFGAVLLLSPWWVWAGVAPGDLPWLAVETLGYQILIIAFGFLLGALASDWGRVVLWTIMLMVGMFVWIGAAQMASNLALGGAAQVSFADLLAGRMWQAAVLTVPCLLAIAAHQAVTRRLVRSLLLVAAWGGLMFGLGQQLPWLARLEPSAVKRSEGVVDVGAATQVALRSGVTALPYPRSNLTRDEGWVQVPLVVRGVPAGYAVRVRQIQHEWRWAGGPVVERYGSGASIQGSRLDRIARLIGGSALNPPPLDAETLRWQEAQQRQVEARRRERGLPAGVSVPRARPVESGDESSITLTEHVLLPRSILARLREQPAEYVATLRLGYARLELKQDLPLDRSSQWESRDGRIRLQPVETMASEPRFRTLRLAPAYWSTGLWNKGTPALAFNRRRDFARTEIYLLNPSEGGLVNAQFSSRASPCFIAGIQIDAGEFTLRGRKVVRNGVWTDADPHWKDHSSLVFVTYAEEGYRDHVVGPTSYQLEPLSTEAGTVTP